MSSAICRTCVAHFARQHPSQKYCDKCRDEYRSTAKEVSPAVYRFFSPDARSYVGSARRVKLGRERACKGGVFASSERAKNSHRKHGDLRCLSACHPNAQSENCSREEERDLINVAVREALEGLRQLSSDHPIDSTVLN